MLAGTRQLVIRERHTMSGIWDTIRDAFHFFGFCCLMLLCSPIGGCVIVAAGLLAWVLAEMGVVRC
jgi:hypothetical protein